MSIWISIFIAGIINYLTRMRFVDKNCMLDLKNNTVTAADGYKPWFKYCSKTHEKKKQYEKKD